MDTESLNSELDKFVLVYFYFHFIFVLFQKKKGRCYDICIFYLIASEFCISSHLHIRLLNSVSQATSDQTRRKI